MLPLIIMICKFFDDINENTYLKMYRKCSYNEDYNEEKYKERIILSLSHILFNIASVMCN